MHLPRVAPFLAIALLAFGAGVAIASNPTPVPVSIARQALSFVDPAQDATEHFYENAAPQSLKNDAAQVAIDLTHAQEVLNSANYSDPRIPEILASMKAAEADIQAAHNAGQHADNLAQAVKRDLSARLGTPTP